jgi:hypothetical protein
MAAQVRRLTYAASLGPRLASGDTPAKLAWGEVRGDADIGDRETTAHHHKRGDSVPREHPLLISSIKFATHSNRE